ncbi:hypothetical protein KJ359_012471 [Pestalotiopsis sp. 9143b]|nr:hypothetical protein KJ359_012471 [Pestalotiopsis sp. 9143b]
MSALLLSRTAFRSRAVVGAGIGLSIGSALAYRQPALRMDARAVPRPSTREAATTTPPRDSRLDPEIIRQLSGGSITAALERDPAFKLSFGFFFAMSAFMKFQSL